MTINKSGTFDPDEKEAILNSMMADAKEQFGDDLYDNEFSVIRMFYEPIAERLSESQVDIAEVLKATQIKNANGKALDLLVEQIGIKRKPATFSTGIANFSRSSAATVDYTIPAGSIIQTNSTEPVQFKTTNTATLLAGQVSVSVPIKAVLSGADSNIGSNTLTEMTEPPVGIESVVNLSETSGGSNEETDDELRSRAVKEIGNGSRSSATALVRGMNRVPGVQSVSIFINDTPDTDTEGRPPYSFELVVEGGDPQDVADKILELKAAGDTTIGGISGVPMSHYGNLPNGQSHLVNWSKPSPVQIYIDATVTTTKDYSGNDDVKDSIVNYVGGIFTSGNRSTSESLSGGENVLIGEIEFAIRQVPGVYDVENLQIGTTASPTATDNIVISSQEVATANGVDGSLTINDTQIQ